MPDDRILVSVNMGQKNELLVNGVVFRTANRYETNYREKSPVVAQVISGNNILQSGDILLCHHNHFYPPSPYYLYDDLFSIPYNKTIFGVYRGSDYYPVCGNVFGELVDIPSPIKEGTSKKYKDRIKVTNGGSTGFRPRDLVFTRPSAPYEIVFMVDKEEHRIVKVSEDQICGVAKKYYADSKK